MKKSLWDHNYVVSADATLKEALAAITDNRKRAIVVVDANETCLGVVSDGDIRRAILRGAIMETPLLSLVNVNTRVVREDDRDAADQIFSERQDFTLVPVVGERNKLVDVITRD